MTRPHLSLSPERLHAVVFDLDGVLTDTAGLHETAWKETFDAFLRARAGPFDSFSRQDYRAYVDGRRREDGVRAFLESRGIEIPEGSETDPPDAETMKGLSRRKNEAVQEQLRRDSVSLPGAEALLRALRRAGIGVAVASSSANAGAVLKATGLDRFVQIRVDGVDSAQLELPSKPNPALFREALRRLEVEPARAAIFEDAIAGVEAGRRVGFGTVIGVGRGQHAEALVDAGADMVVADLSVVDVA
jgi:beta-phosphoglucomutase family hydrolase|tara:strand:- start:10983 stop:11720 length:738 start_codon:yes stop_codon:yes gene_type:complete